MGDIIHELCTMICILFYFLKCIFGQYIIIIIIIVMAQSPPPSVPWPPHSQGF